MRGLTKRSRPREKLRRNRAWAIEGSILVRAVRIAAKKITGLPLDRSGSDAVKSHLLLKPSCN